jgi:hypothetical protein
VISSVTVRCVACSATRVIRPNDVAPGDVPMCNACFSPMVAVSAIEDYDDALRDARQAAGQRRNEAS